MLMRVATFKTAPSDDRQWVLDALSTVPGVRAAYHALDRETGAALSVSVFDDEAASDAALDAIRRAATARGHQGTPPDEIRFCEVVELTEPAFRPSAAESHP